MSSTLQSSFSAVQHNYVSLASLVAVGYDYILLFPREIEYIWSKPRTWVSALFIVVRYCGLVNLIEKKFHTGPYRGQILGDTEYLTYIFFLGAADIVMILRVWAIHRRSRMVLGILLSLFAVEIISMGVALVVYVQSRSEQYPIIQAQGLDYTFCVRRVRTPMFQVLSNIFQITFAAALCILAVIRLVKESLQTYKVSKQWQLNRYVNVLLQQGIVYFFVILMLNLIDLLSSTGKIPGSGWRYILACVLADMPAYTFTPRFIISLREMSANDIQDRPQCGIDSALGLTTVSICDRGAREPIRFTPGVQGETADNIETDDGQNKGREDIELVSRGRA